jgi:hypothetical protein
VKVRAVVSYEVCYRLGRQFHFAPSVAGVRLAAITPSEYEVEVFVRQTRLHHSSPMVFQTSVDQGRIVI